MDGDEALGLVGGGLEGVGEKGDGLVGIVELGDGGFKGGDDLGKGLALGAATGFDAGEVGDAGENEAIGVDFGDVDDAVEDGSGPSGCHEAEAAVGEDGEWTTWRAPVK